MVVVVGDGGRAAAEAPVDDAGVGGLSELESSRRRGSTSDVEVESIAAISTSAVWILAPVHLVLPWLSATFMTGFQLPTYRLPHVSRLSLTGSGQAVDGSGWGWRVAKEPKHPCASLEQAK